MKAIKGLHCQIDVIWIYSCKCIVYIAFHGVMSVASLGSSADSRSVLGKIWNIYYIYAPAMCTLHLRTQYTKRQMALQMGSLLGPVLTNIFMTDLESTLLPKLAADMTPWKRYVDNTFATIDPNYINLTLQTLNSFHPSITLTSELEKEKQLPFLGLLLLHKDLALDTKVFRKQTNNDIYIHWDSYSPRSRKIGTLQSMILRVFKICSNLRYRQKELNHITSTFTKSNSYPVSIVKSVVDIIESGIIGATLREAKDNTQLLIFPYMGMKGDKTIKSLRNTINSINPLQTKIKIVYKSTKLSTKFNIKDITKKQYLHSIVYRASCPTLICGATYISETGRRIAIRVEESQ